MTDSDGVCIGSKRAKAEGTAGLAASVISAGFVVWFAHIDGEALITVLYCLLIIGALVRSYRGFGNRVDIDDSGVTGARTRLLRRPFIAWTDIASVGTAGETSLFNPARTEVTTTEGRLVRLRAFGLDLDAAERATGVVQDAWDRRRTATRSSS